MEDRKDPEAAEREHVHQVYQEIAQHFSDTRYKPWPLVEKFLQGQKRGSVGIDVGCGNGKYLGVNKHVLLIGSDRSSGLIEAAKAKNTQYELMISDGLDVPFCRGRFDFAISIAVIHHFSTPQRRVEAIQAILSSLVSGGTALIYVWALEQKNSRRGWDETSPADVLVPWVLPDKTIRQRYYHLYARGELESDCQSAGAYVVESGYERDNWWAIISRNHA